MDKVRAKKHLGQHFLTEPAIAMRIAEALPPLAAHVLEIGPGTGILTRALLERSIPDLHLVEIDSESVAYLLHHHPNLKGRITEGDFLDMPLETHFGGAPFYVVGNFPYNISSQILFRVVEDPLRVQGLVGMFQREVARRITAGHGNKDYGILTVLAHTWYRCEYLFTVNEGSFNPPPRVKSGVIRLTRNERTALPIPYSFFKTVVKLSFGQRRKALRNSLAPVLNPHLAKAHATALALRPEQLSPEDFLHLAAALYPGAEEA